VIADIIGWAIKQVAFRHGLGVKRKGGNLAIMVFLLPAIGGGLIGAITTAASQGGYRRV
jgi:hypothetical protein